MNPLKQIDHWSIRTQQRVDGATAGQRRAVIWLCVLPIIGAGLILALISYSLVGEQPVLMPVAGTVERATPWGSPRGGVDGLRIKLVEHPANFTLPGGRGLLRQLGGGTAIEMLVEQEEYGYSLDAAGPNAEAELRVPIWQISAAGRELLSLTEGEQQAEKQARGQIWASLLLVLAGLALGLFGHFRAPHVGSAKEWASPRARGEPKMSR